MTARQRVLDVAPTAVLLAGGLLQLTLDYDGAGFHGSRATNAAFLVAVSVPLVARRRWPAAVLAIVLLAMAGWLAASYRGSGQPPFEPFAAGVVAAFALGFHADTDELRKGLVMFGVLLIGSTIALEVIGEAVGGGIGVPVWWLAAIGIGRALRDRQVLIDLLQERSSRLERDIAEAAAEERTRIARELHDVIAHAVSLIVVQASAERRLLGDDQERTAETLVAIEESGRDALGELRRLLGVIRAKEDEQLAPQPKLAALPELIEESRRAGQTVRLHVEGEPMQLAPGLDLTAYRIAQEALTNARKHTSSAEVDVVVRWGARELELEVTDDGGTASKQANGTGHGLIGMRERAALFGGEVTAEPMPGGGFKVHAFLPVEIRSGS